MREVVVDTLESCVMCGEIAEFEADETGEALCRYCNSINNLIRNGKGLSSVYIPIK